MDKGCIFINFLASFLLNNFCFIQFIKRILIPSILNNLYVEKYRLEMLLECFLNLLCVLWEYKYINIRKYCELIFAEISIIFKELNTLLQSQLLHARAKTIILKYYQHFFETPTDIIQIFINFDSNPEVPYNLLIQTASSLSILLDNTWEVKDEIDEFSDIQKIRDLAIEIILNIQKTAMDSMCTVYYGMTNTWSKDCENLSLSVKNQNSKSEVL